MYSLRKKSSIFISEFNEAKFLHISYKNSNDTPYYSFYTPF